MKKNHTILFDIPSPCQKDWENMTPQDQGRHCELCNKVVVDFTNMSDEEVLTHFKKSKTNVCGRIKSERLEQTPRWKYVAYAKIFLYAFAVIFFMGISEVGEAQVKTQSSDNVDALKYNSIKGRVLDEKGEPLAYATLKVFYDGKQIGGVVSDKNGQYRFSRLKNGIYYIVLTSIGYQTQESKKFELKGKQGMELNFKMSDKHLYILGGAMRVSVPAKYLYVDPRNPGRKIIYGNQIKHAAY